MIQFGVLEKKTRTSQRVKPGKYLSFKDWHVDLGIELATKAEISSSDIEKISVPFRSNLVLKKRRTKPPPAAATTTTTTNLVRRRPTVKLEHEVKERQPGRNFTPIMIDFPFRRLGIQFQNGIITGASRSGLALGVRIGDSIWKINNMDIKKDAMVTPDMAQMDIDRRILYIVSKCSSRPLRIHFWRPNNSNKVQINKKNLRKNRRGTSMQICAQKLKELRLKSLNRESKRKSTSPLLQSRKTGVDVKVPPPNLWHAQPCRQCCAAHTRYSRNCIDCGDPFCRECKKAFMEKLGKKRWVCLKCKKIEKEVQKKLDSIHGSSTTSSSKGPPILKKRMTMKRSATPPPRIHQLVSSKTQQSKLKYQHSSSPNLQRELFAVLQRRKKSKEKKSAKE
jgi:hypothetical protein